MTLGLAPEINTHDYNDDDYDCDSARRARSARAPLPQLERLMISLCVARSMLAAGDRKKGGRTNGQTAASLKAAFHTPMHVQELCMPSVNMATEGSLQ